MLYVSTSISIVNVYSDFEYQAQRRDNIHRRTDAYGTQCFVWFFFLQIRYTSKGHRKHAFTAYYSGGTSTGGGPARLKQNVGGIPNNVLYERRNEEIASWRSSGVVKRPEWFALGEQINTESILSLEQNTRRPLRGPRTRWT